MTDAGPLVLISHGLIKAGKLQGFKAYAKRFMAAVAEREPRVHAFDTYLDEAGERYTTVQVHPDAWSMEHHMMVMAEEIGAAFEYVRGPTAGLRRSLPASIGPRNWAAGGSSGGLPEPKACPLTPSIRSRGTGT